jgi:predicted nucleotidyltransferase
VSQSIHDCEDHFDTRQLERRGISGTTGVGEHCVARRLLALSLGDWKYQMSHQPNNIFAGTQVVSLVEVRGTNHSLVHPRGAVGVVTRTPAVEGEAFLVRFPDGFEKSLQRSQIEVLKHFKDRLGDGSQSAEFDLESFIIYRCVVGSRAYGLDNDESDTDRRGIYLAPAELQWSLFGAPEQFEDNATQSCYWELQKFLTMALKANPNILECLYSPMVEKVTPLGAELISARQGFLSQMIFQTFNGYAMSQFKKIEQDIRNHGEVRWKHAMHLLRLLMTGAATLREARVPVRVEGHRERLLAIKRAEMPWAEVDAWRKELHQDFERALAETKLPERPDYEAANRFLIKARQEIAIQERQ